MISVSFTWVVFDNVTSTKEKSDLFWSEEIASKLSFYEQNVRKWSDRIMFGILNKQRLIINGNDLFHVLSIDQLTNKWGNDRHFLLVYIFDNQVLFSQTIWREKKEDEQCRRWTKYDDEEREREREETRAHIAID